MNGAEEIVRIFVALKNTNGECKRLTDALLPSCILFSLHSFPSESMNAQSIRPGS
jgi:hypothetical protein